MQYTVYTFEVSPLIQGNDLVIASLSELAFDSFQETESGVEAYVPTQFDTEELQNALLELTIEDVTIHFSKKEMEDIKVYLFLSLSVVFLLILLLGLPMYLTGVSFEDLLK